MSDCVPPPFAFLMRDYGKDRRGDKYAAPIICTGENWALVKDSRHGVRRWSAPDQGFVMYFPDWPRTTETQPAKVLLCYLQRPCCVGQNIKHGFQLAGCQVRTAGPISPLAWGRSTDTADFVMPDYFLDDRQHDINEVLALVALGGFKPDLVVGVDHNDDFYLSGGTSAAKFVNLTVENWDEASVARLSMRSADAEYWCVRHWQRGDVEGAVTIVTPIEDRPPPVLPSNVERFVFAVDTVQRPFLGLPRDKLVAQIGIPYDPRPTVWNHLRKVFDNAVALSPEEYNVSEPHETGSTIFGIARTHRRTTDIYNRSECVLSCSNQDFVPNRIPDAFATGAIQISDDVPSMRECFGAPWPENPEGIWVSHDRTPESMEARVRELMAKPDVRAQIRARAFVFVHGAHTYAHRARQLLSRVGLDAGLCMIP